MASRLIKSHIDEEKDIASEPEELPSASDHEDDVGPSSFRESSSSVSSESPTRLTSSSDAGTDRKDILKSKAGKFSTLKSLGASFSKIASSVRVSTVTPPTPIAAAIKQGFLKKRPNGVGAWQKRYFVLTDSKLLYFKSDPLEAPKGHIDVKTILSVKESHIANVPPCSIDIVTDSRLYVVSAASDSELSEWITALRSVSNCAESVGESESDVKDPVVAGAAVQLKGYLLKHNGRKLQRRFCVLTSDRLLYYKDSKEEKKLGEILLEDILESTAFPDLLKLNIMTGYRMFMFMDMAADVTKRPGEVAAAPGPSLTTWKEKIDAMVTASQADLEADAARSLEPDHVTSICTRCRLKFNAFRRRHHCRKCGRIFCSDCAHEKYKAKLIGYEKPQRHCIDCFRNSGKERRKELKDLKDKLSTVKPAVHEPSISLESPLQRLIVLLGSMKSELDESGDERLQNILHEAMQLLQRGDIYQPVAKPTGGLTHDDAYITKWLTESHDVAAGQEEPARKMYASVDETASRWSWRREPDDARLRKSTSDAMTPARGVSDRSDSDSHTPKAVDDTSTFPDDPGSLEMDVGRVHQYLETAALEEFDAFTLYELTNGAVLYHTVLWMVEKLDLVASCKISKVCLSNFAAAVQGTKANSYHNPMHGADVVVGMYHSLLTVQNRVNTFVFTDVEIFAAVIAAAVHDFEHNGLTNNFLIKTSDPLAILYNDRNVLESHHCAAAFRVLRSPDSNIIAGLDDSQYLTFRRILLSAVLATDMKDHFRNTEHFHQWLTAKEAANGLATLGAEVKQQPNDTEVIISAALKLCDVGHLMKATAIHRKWAFRIEEELFLVGDLEAERGMDKSMFCDKAKRMRKKSQLGFMDYLVKPLMDLWCQFTHDQVRGKYFAANREYWDNYKDDRDEDDDEDDDDT